MRESPHHQEGVGLAISPGKYKLSKANEEDSLQLKGNQTAELWEDRVARPIGGPLGRV